MGVVTYGCPLLPLDDEELLDLFEAFYEAENIM